MKKVFMIVLGLLTMMTASLSAKAQEVTFLLRPGWNWIGYPYPESASIEIAFGDFEPVSGDVIESEFGYSEYFEDYGWFGGIQNLEPGKGYIYYSNRTGPVTIVFGTPSSQSQVTVTTSEPMLITAISAMGGGEVTTNDGTYIIVKGLCWAAHENPTTNDDFYEEVESGVGTFSISMTELNMATTYYVRAYAVTPNGTVYGDQKSFTTRDGIPEVSTAEVTNILGWSADCGGIVTDNGGMEVIARGICWSTSHNPTLNDSHTTDGAGLGGFVSTITGLNYNTTYFVRAYATTSFTTNYGNEVFFTTAAQTWANGVLPGTFSVSEGRQVQFSQGNLQYRASIGIWRFAEHQYDYVGVTNSNIGPNYDGWIDLFGWGTSGYNHGAICYQPWSTSQNNQNYYAYGIDEYNLFDQNGQADWGYNAIENGGNNENSGWRTLTKEEWAYLINERVTPSDIRFAKAMVNGVNGVILLPDEWNVSSYGLNNTNMNDAAYSSNIISSFIWSNLFEPYGAVFLPAAGFRKGSNFDLRFWAYYWLSSSHNNNAAYSICFTDTGLYSEHGDQKSDGQSVRLVKVYYGKME